MWHQTRLTSAVFLSIISCVTFLSAPSLKDISVHPVLPELLRGTERCPSRALKTMPVAPPPPPPVTLLSSSQSQKSHSWLMTVPRLLHHRNHHPRSPRFCFLFFIFFPPTTETINVFKYVVMCSLICVFSWTERSDCIIRRRTRDLANWFCNIREPFIFRCLGRYWVGREPST